MDYGDGRRMNNAPEMGRYGRMSMPGKKKEVGATLVLSENSALIVNRNLYEGNETAGIRFAFNKDGEWIPNSRGVNLKPDPVFLDKVIAALQSVRDDFAKTPAQVAERKPKAKNSEAEAAKAALPSKTRATKPSADAVKPTVKTAKAPAAKTATATATAKAPVAKSPTKAATAKAPVKAAKPAKATKAETIDEDVPQPSAKAKPPKVKKAKKAKVSPRTVDLADDDDIPF